jgi:hypothetical protein
MLLLGIGNENRVERCKPAMKIEKNKRNETLKGNKTELSICEMSFSLGRFQPYSPSSGTQLDYGRFPRTFTSLPTVRIHYFPVLILISQLR